MRRLARAYVADRAARQQGRAGGRGGGGHGRGGGARGGRRGHPLRDAARVPRPHLPLHQLRDGATLPDGGPGQAAGSRRGRRAGATGAGILTREMITYYAHRAAEYERVYTIPRWQEDLEHIRERIRTVFTGRRVFEVACGTGYWSPHAGA